MYGKRKSLPSWLWSAPYYCSSRHSGYFGAGTLTTPPTHRSLFVFMMSANIEKEMAISCQNHSHHWDDMKIPKARVELTRVWCIQTGRCPLVWVNLSRVCSTTHRLRHSSFTLTWLRFGNISTQTCLVFKCTNIPMNAWWAFLQWRNMGRLVSSASSNCFSKYLHE